jgi:histidyl-tRNA synthetase
MAAVIAQADALREAGYSVNLITQKKKLGKQIGHCEAAGYAGFMVFGRDEAVKAFDGE